MVSADSSQDTSISNIISTYDATILDPVESVVVNPIKQVATWLGLSKASDGADHKKTKEQKTKNNATQNNLLSDFLLTLNAPILIPLEHVASWIDSDGTDHKKNKEQKTKNNATQNTSISDVLSTYDATILDPVESVVVNPIKQVATWLGLSKASDGADHKKTKAQASHNIYNEAPLQHVVEFNEQLTQSLKRNISKNVENPYNIIVHKTSVDVVPTATKYDYEARNMANQFATAIRKAGQDAKVVKTSKGYTVVVVTKKPNKSSTSDSDNWTKLIRMMLIEQEAESEAKSKATTQAGVLSNNTLLYVALLAIVVVAIIYYVMD